MSKANILKETVRGYQAISIEDELLQSREIFLTEEVTTETMNELLKQLIYLEREDNTKEITIYINSPGGEVSCGLAIYDYLLLMKSPIRTVCTGTAASMASVLFLAGDKREMFKHTKIMIHDPSYGGGSFAGLKPLQIKEKLDDIMECREIIAGIIAEKTNRSLEEIYAKTERDSYFSAEKAIEFGLATKIIDNLYA